MDELRLHMARVLEARGWSLRGAQDMTGVNYSTIRNMSRGERVGPEFLIRWARAIEEPATDWLVWGGFPEVAVEFAGRPTRRDIPRGMPEPGEESQEPPRELTIEEFMQAAQRGMVTEESAAELWDAYQRIMARDRREAELQRRLAELEGRAPEE